MVCPGWNDGEQLLRTLSDLRALAPAAQTAAMVPVGGFYTIGPQEAKALLDDLRPKVFLPMHYRMGAVGLPAVGQVEDFLSLVENYVYYPTDTLSLDEGNKTQIAVLHCSV